MSLQILVDGYNLIHARDLIFDPGDLEQARNTLLDWCAGYKRAKGHAVTVVFDAYKSAGLDSRRDMHKGVSVHYSPYGKSADALLVEMAQKLGPKAVVVTNDREVGQKALMHNAAWVTSSLFADRLLEACLDGAIPQDEAALKPSSLRDTRKKGPGRKPKKSRRKAFRMQSKL
ncbi:MAG: NYN domain-containing protein [Desulfatibacillaceae bacterium]|nr:NYN domain-containing protein [Desulfatibacillaceae bacterium]